MKKSLMIIESSPFMRIAMETLFKKSGKWGPVISAQNGFEALDILHYTRPELICIGEDLPLMDSRSLILEIVRLKQLLILPEDTKVVIMTRKCREQLAEKDLKDCPDCLIVMEAPSIEAEEMMEGLKILERSLHSLIAS